MSQLRLAALALLASTACDRLVMVSAAESGPSPFASDAGVPFAAPSLETSAWASALSLPREVRVAVTGPDRHRSHCDASELVSGSLVGCETVSGWHVGAGDYVLAVSSIAVDGLRDELTRPITLRGDELRVEVHVLFDDDGAPAELLVSMPRRPPPGLALRRVGDPQEVGEPPRFALENRTEETFFAPGFVFFGEVALLEAYEPRPPPQAVRTCGTVAGWDWLEPGDSLEVTRRYAMGGWPRLTDGLYAFRVALRSSRTDGAEPIVVEEEFEVLGSPGPLVDDEVGALFASAFAADEAERATDLPRPGEARPAGLEGSLDAIAAPLVRSGATLAGTLEPRALSRYYRLEALEGQHITVRGFARCERDPCEAELTILTGADPDDLLGSGAELRRGAGRWSRRTASFRADSEDPLLAFRCVECRAPVTYFVRVEVRDPAWW